ncbi:MAG: threonine synthase [Candidatus Marinimicrobia bacterium]|nr:threonine synthase [Candidatus Neomarinimicrobiota bacterium]
MNSNYKCIDCGAEYSSDRIIYLCPKCEKEQKPDEFQKGVLQTKLDPVYLKSLSRKTGISPDDFSVYKTTHSNAYPVGNTPLISPESLRQKTGFKHLYFKNDSTNPSGSLKDRASKLVAAQAMHFKEKVIALASTGNAGSAMACAGAAYGLDVVLFIPESAPKAKLIQSLLYGAKVIPIKGTYDDAFKLSIEFTNMYGGINRNTAYNPLTIEGKKTVSIEIYNQLKCNPPDIVYLPVGDGVIYSGVYKGFTDLREAGLIENIPQIVGVQSAGSNAISRAFHTGEMEVLESVITIADSISVVSPACGRMAVEYLKSCKGWTTEVTDDEISKAQLQLCSDSGIFVEPAAAASWAGFLKDSAKLDKDRTIVVLLTGIGFKDMKAVENIVPIPDSIKPEIKEVEELF